MQQFTSKNQNCGIEKDFSKLRRDKTEVVGEVLSVHYIERTRRREERKRWKRGRRTGRGRRTRRRRRGPEWLEAVTAVRLEID